MTDYGADLECWDDITADALELPGDEVELVAQACWRRLITSRGELIDDAEYGLGLTDMLSRGMTKRQLDALPGMIKKELLKDDRVASVAEVNVEELRAGAYTISIRGTASDGGPFSLTRALDTALIKELTS